MLCLSLGASLPRKAKSILLLFEGNAASLRLYFQLRDVLGNMFSLRWKAQSLHIRQWGKSLGNTNSHRKLLFTFQGWMCRGAYSTKCSSWLHLKHALLSEMHIIYISLSPILLRHCCIINPLKVWAYPFLANRRSWICTEMNIMG